MEKILVFLMAASLTSSNIAEEKAPKEVLFQALCVSSTILDATLSKYEEMPMIRGQSNRNGKEQTFVLFMNMDTRTWTIAEQVDEDLFCVTGIGNGIEPVPQSDEKYLPLNEKTSILNNNIAV